jgi:hypothetical protein
MLPNTSAPLKLNAMKAINGVGIVIAVILGIILGIPNVEGAPPGFTETQHMFYFVIPLPVLMLCAYKRVVIDPADRRIQITKGIWPITVRNEIPFADSVEIQLDAMKGRWVSYSAFLSLDGQQRPILLLADGDENQLRSIVNFSQTTGLRLKPKQGMKSFAPDWARAAIPELKSTDPLAQAKVRES